MQSVKKIPPRSYTASLKMSDDAQGFDIAMASPFAQFILLTGILPPETGFGSDDLETYTARYNLSKLHPSLLPSQLDPNKTSVTAAVGLSSINNSDNFDAWTWAVDEVTHEINNKGELLLNINIAGQGGGPDAPDLIFVGDVIGNLAYNVIVLTRQ
jgi:hypothetical protein